MVVFPGTVVPLTIRREASLKLLDASLPESKVIGLITQRDATKDDPTPEDLYKVGTAGNVIKLLRQPDETILIHPSALFFKDPTVQMHLHAEYPASTGGLSYTSQNIWLRLYGPGRVKAKALTPRLGQP